jgi:hypothetical protein
MSEPPKWTVVVLRAWIDSGRLRARMLRTDDAGDTERAAGSDPAYVARIVEGWLNELLTGQDDSQTSGRRRRRRWLPRFGQ